MTGKQHLTFGIVTGIAFSAYLQKKIFARQMLTWCMLFVDPL